MGRGGRALSEAALRAYPWLIQGQPPPFLPPPPPLIARLKKRAPHVGLVNIVLSLPFSTPSLFFPKLH